MKKNQVYQSHQVTWCLCCLFVVHLAFPSLFFLLFVGSPVHNSLIAYFLPVWVVQPLTPHSHSIIPPLHTWTSTSFTTLLIRFCVLLHLFCSFDSTLAPLQSAVSPFLAVSHTHNTLSLLAVFWLFTHTPHTHTPSQLNSFHTPARKSAGLPASIYSIKREVVRKKTTFSASFSTHEARLYLHP